MEQSPRRRLERRGVHGWNSHTVALVTAQLEWLRNFIAQVPGNQLIVLVSLFPLLDYADERAARPEVVQGKKIYEIPVGREVAAVGGTPTAS